MQHIDKNKGTFISILPATRRETTSFKEQLRLQSVQVNWQPLAFRSAIPSSNRYRYYEDESTAEGFRVIWIQSVDKVEQDRQRRAHRIKKVLTDLEQIASKLNKYKLKTKEQIEQAVTKKLNGCAVFFEIIIEEHRTLTKKQVGRGKPHAGTSYKEVEKIHYELNYHLRTDVVESYEHQDGIFPLVTNCDWQVQTVFETYKEQPFLEKRFATLKSVLNVAPIFLKKPERIEAMLLLYFFALMVVALIERQIRNSMKEQQIESIPILPQKMKTKSPTINNLRYLFNDTLLVAVQTTENAPINYIKKGLDKIHL